MNKDTFDKLLNQLKENLYHYTFDYYFDRGVSVIRGLYVDDAGDNHLKNKIDNDLLKDIKLQKSYNWYLGEKKKAVYMKFKDVLEMEIPELESYQISNYA
jgi:hypothetical protein